MKHCGDSSVCDTAPRSPLVLTSWNHVGTFPQPFPVPERQPQQSSRISRRQILECNWLLNGSSESSDSEQQISPEQGGQQREEIAERKENFDGDLTSFNSVDTHTYVMADPSDEIISVASSTFESSCSSSFLSDQHHHLARLTPKESGSFVLSDQQNPVRLPPRESISCSNNGRSSRSSSRSNSCSERTTEVRKVREMFERRRIELLEDEVKPFQVHRRVRLTSENQENNNGSSGDSILPFQGLRAALSTQNIENLDVEEEEYPIFGGPPGSDQHRKIRDLELWETTPGSPRWPSLRRWKSMGTNVFPSLPAKDTARESRAVRGGDDKNWGSIPAEEMPAPNIVKSVRSVFEQMLCKKDSHRQRLNSFLSLKAPVESAGWPSENLLPSLSNLRTTKSQKIFEIAPTSKKDSRQSQAEQIEATSGAPKQMEEPKQIQDQTKETGIWRCATNGGSETGAWKGSGTNGESRYEKRVTRATGNIVSLNWTPQPWPVKGHQQQQQLPSNKFILNSKKGSRNSDDGDQLDCSEPPKIISESVLSRIRSFGTTTTYFGGTIIGQTVMNKRVLPPMSLQNPPKSINKDLEDLTPSVTTICDDLDDPSRIFLKDTRVTTATATAPRVVSVHPKLGLSRSNLFESGPNKQAKFHEGSNNNNKGQDNNSTAVTDGAPTDVNNNISKEEEGPEISFKLANEVARF